MGRRGGQGFGWNLSLGWDAAQYWGEHDEPAVWNTAAARLNLFTKGSRQKASSLVFFEWTEAELVRSAPPSESLFGNILAQHGMGGAWPRFVWRVLDSGSAWHGWNLAMASLGGCWILAQHGTGGAWLC